MVYPLAGKQNDFNLFSMKLDALPGKRKIIY
jgi:hypothetical protein